MAGLVPFNRRSPSLVGTGFNDFYNMLDDFFADTWPLRRSLAADTFKVDVKELEKEYSVEAELPGVKKDEIGISIDEGRLVIAVNREENIENKDESYIHRERRCTSMSRGVYLGDADTKNVKARLEDGILKITVPKTEKAEKRIKIDID